MQYYYTSTSRNYFNNTEPSIIEVSTILDKGEIVRHLLYHKKRGNFILRFLHHKNTRDTQRKKLTRATYHITSYVSGAGSKSCNPIQMNRHLVDASGSPIYSGAAPIRRGDVSIRSHTSNPRNIIMIANRYRIPLVYGQVAAVRYQVRAAEKQSKS